MADRGRTVRQRKYWHLIGDTVLSFTANATGLLGSLTLVGDEPFTVIRSLGELSIAPAAAGVVAGDATSVAVGIGVVSTDAITAGAASLPDPAAEPDFP